MGRYVSQKAFSCYTENIKRLVILSFGHLGCRLRFSQVKFPLQDGRTVPQTDTERLKVP